MTEKTITVTAVPNTIEAFVALRNELATTPQGGAAILVVAMHLFTQDKDLGLAAMTIAVDRSLLQDGPKGYKGKQLTLPTLRALEQRVGWKPYIPASYFQGTSPEGGYALPAPPLTVAVREQAGGIGVESSKVFVHSTGADSPRPVHLKVNNRGLWKAYNYSSLELGCRPPVQVADDDL